MQSMRVIHSSWKRSFVAKCMTGAALAATLLIAAPQKAQAQVAFQIGVGSYPVQTYSTYGAYDGNPYGGWRHDDWRVREYDRERAWQAQQAAAWRHQQWEQHGRWERRDGYGFHGGRY